MYRNNQNLKHNKTMEKNSITENDIRATLSGGKNISKPKFIVLLILLCICFLGTLASGIMIIINSERIAEIVIYALIILAVLFLYMYPIYTVVNHKKKIRLWLADAVLLDAYCYRSFDDPSIMNMRWSAVNQNDNMRRNSFGAKISVSFFYDNQQFVRRSGSKKQNTFLYQIDGYNAVYKKYVDLNIKILYSPRYDEVMIPEQ